MCVSVCVLKARERPWVSYIILRLMPLKQGLSLSCSSRLATSELSDLPVSAPHPTVLELKQHSDHIHLM